MKTGPPVLLLIVDDTGSLKALPGALDCPALEILTAADARAGVELIYASHPHIVVADSAMPGLELLDRVMAFDPGIDVVLLTSHYSTESAVEAINKGASDLLEKPVSLATLQARIGKLIASAERRQKRAAIEDEMLASSEFEGIVGHSPLMNEMFSSIQKIAPHFRNLLLVGETGTGKELAARALHRLGPMPHGNFVVLNCSASASADTLAETERFDAGTLFLREIGDMPLSMQARLLRALQNKGNTRVIAATNQDLRKAVAAHRFREELYYRLSMLEIRVPRLADRKEDIPLLIRHFTARFGAQYGKSIRGITGRAQIALAQHHWPGNVRELENAIGRASVMLHGDVIDLPDLPDYLRMRATGPAPLGALGDHERQLVVHAMEAAGGNQSRAARILQIGRDALRYKLKKYHLQNGY
jgi:DNA-binding NtrC family response regulator